MIKIKRIRRVKPVKVVKVFGLPKKEEKDLEKRRKHLTKILG